MHHRPIFLDFNTALLLGQRNHPLQSHKTRGVKTKDITSVETYINHLYKDLTTKEAFHHQTQLDNNSASPVMVEELDSLIGLSEEAAEAKCLRRRPEYYSTTIAQQRMEVSILKRHLNALKTNRDRTQQLLNKLRLTGITIALPETQHLTKHALQDARQRLQETSKTSFRTRQAELTHQIQEAQQLGDRNKVKRLKAIRNTEKSNRVNNYTEPSKQCVNPQEPSHNLTESKYHLAGRLQPKR